MEQQEVTIEQVLDAMVDRVGQLQVDISILAAQIRSVEKAINAPHTHEHPAVASGDDD